MAVADLEVGSLKLGVNAGLPLVDQTITRPKNVAQPPFVLLMNLDRLREQIHRARIVVLVGHLRAFAHFRDHDEFAYSTNAFAVC